MVLNSLNFPVTILRTGCVKSLMTKKYSRKGFIMAVKLHHTKIFRHISSLVWDNHFLILIYEKASANMYCLKERYGDQNKRSESPIKVNFIVLILSSFLFPLQISWFLKWRPMFWQPTFRLPWTTQSTYFIKDPLIEVPKKINEVGKLFVEKSFNESIILFDVCM